MSAGFGFSVGDIIAGLKVIKTAVDALKDSKGAVSEFQGLVQEIESLKDGLDALDDLEQIGCLEQNSKQKIAIQNAVSQCRGCIDCFMARIAKYQPWLQARPVLGPTAWKGCVAKIRWSVCKREDVARFRAQLAGHSSSIKMLLLTIQVNQSFTASERQLDMNSGIEGIQETTLELRANMMSGVQFLESLSHEQKRFFETIMRSNQQNNTNLILELQEIKSLLRTQQNIPPQVLLSKPVTLLDACGKLTAFHLDFINSSAAFVAVMKVRFQQEGVTHTGIKMLEDTQFVLNDHRGALPMSKPWNQLLKPNQKVNMSMLFRRTVPASTCPACYIESRSSDQEIECTECGLFYRRVLEKTIPSRIKPAPLKALPSHNYADGESLNSFSSESEVPEEDVIEQFRRVHVVSREISLKAKQKQKLPSSVKATVVSLRLPFPIRCWTCQWSNVIPSGTIWKNVPKEPMGTVEGKTRSVIRKRHDCGQWIELETIEHPFKTSFNVIAGGVAVFGLEYGRANSKDANSYRTGVQSSELFQGELDDDTSEVRVFPGSTWRDNVSVTEQLKDYPKFFAKPKNSRTAPAPINSKAKSTKSLASGNENSLQAQATDVHSSNAAFRHGLIAPQPSSPDSSLDNENNEPSKSTPITLPHAEKQEQPTVTSKVLTETMGRPVHRNPVYIPIAGCRPSSIVPKSSDTRNVEPVQPSSSTRRTPRNLPTMEFLFAGQLHSAIENSVDQKKHKLLGRT